ncbi:MAG: hypothetical protein ABEH64_02620 [Salinirussus sp.]
MSFSLSLELILLAAAGGAFGASIGALPSFSLAGLFVILGELLDLMSVSSPAPADLTGLVGFGVVLGPHVAFGGGAAALAYAARREDALDPKDITEGLGNRPDILAVGATFGVIGHLIALGSGALSLPVDPVALGVVGSAFLHRAAFGYHIVGSNIGWSVLSCRMPRTDGGAATDPWLPYQRNWSEVVSLGLVMGLLGAYIAYLTASPFMAFGLSVVTLAMLCAGVPKVPVTHHMTLPASTVALALAGPDVLTPASVAANVPLLLALFAGAGFGILGGLAGEILQRILYARSQTHLDPPAASIVVTSALIALLAFVGVLPSPVWIPLP